MIQTIITLLFLFNKTTVYRRWVRQGDLKIIYKSLRVKTQKVKNILIFLLEHTRLYIKDELHHYHNYYGA
ncbi:hypothetical protein RIR_jg2987.t1 [Rhizophagus irregularis DAOM 181602=DAOM 197198]|nr:hypothetical protein RIR_jg2987.t1 [Rhizophagus irregularis DAOM 181602=DAOM 197198]